MELAWALPASKRSWTRWKVLASSYLTLNIFLKLWPPSLIIYKTESSSLPRLLHGTVQRAKYGKTAESGEERPWEELREHRPPPRRLPAWAEPPACVARSACPALFLWPPAIQFRDVKSDNYYHHCLFTFGSHLSNRRGWNKLAFLTVTYFME